MLIVDDFCLGKLLVHEYKLVASHVLILVFIVRFRRNASRKEDPFFHGWRPENGFHNEVTGKFSAQRLANEVVLVLPIFATKFAAAIENSNPEIVFIEHSTVRSSVFFAH